MNTDRTDPANLSCAWGETNEIKGEPDHAASPLRQELDGLELSSLVSGLERSDRNKNPAGDPR